MNIHITWLTYMYVRTGPKKKKNCSPAPVFDRLQYAKTEPEGLVILPRDPCHGRHVSSTLRMYGRATEKTDLAFCTSYEDETSADGQQHLAYKTYPS